MTNIDLKAKVSEMWKQGKQLRDIVQELRRASTNMNDVAEAMRTISLVVVHIDRRSTPHLFTLGYKPSLVGNATSQDFDQNRADYFTMNWNTGEIY